MKDLNKAYKDISGKILDQNYDGSLYKYVPQQMNSNKKI